MIEESSSTCSDHASHGDDLTGKGYVHIPPGRMVELLGTEAVAAWQDFARSWDALELDEFMNDGGAYRRRRHAVFRASADSIQRQADRLHFQDTMFNALNGGIERRFAPVAPAVAASPITRRAIAVFSELFGQARSKPPALSWEVEMHQFRIEASDRRSGLPTPEGLHRDGVDWVAMMFVDRCNAAGAVTSIVDEAGSQVAQIEMSRPFEAVALDDRRTRHGVTPLTALDPTDKATRDILVLTYAVR